MGIIFFAEKEHIMADENIAVVTKTARLINVLTGEFNLTLDDFRRVNRNLLFGDTITEDTLATLGYAVILQRKPDGLGDYYEGTPVEINGQYYQNWILRIKTPEEEAAELRNAKNVNLATMDSFKNQALARGVPFNFGTVAAPIFGHIQVRDGDRANILGIVEQARRDPGTAQYLRTYENVLQSLDEQAVVKMSDAALQGYLAIMQGLWSMQGSIEAAGTINDMPIIPANLRDFYVTCANLEWFDI